MTWLCHRLYNYIPVERRKMWVCLFHAPCSYCFISNQACMYVLLFYICIYALTQVSLWQSNGQYKKDQSHCFFPSVSFIRLACLSCSENLSISKSYFLLVIRWSCSDLGICYVSSISLWKSRWKTNKNYYADMWSEFSLMLVVVVHYTYNLVRILYEYHHHHLIL